VVQANVYKQRVNYLDLCYEWWSQRFNRSYGWRNSI